MTLASLSVVVPAFNEEPFIGATMRALRAALDRAEIDPTEVVLVDDGSDDATAEAARAAFGSELIVHAQRNQGRFAARLAGLDRCSREFVFSLDARVELDPDSLAFWAQQRRAHPDRLAWNGHTRTRIDGNPYAAFWQVLTSRVWQAYGGELTGYGPEDFDSYPKGTGMFIAPRAAWHRAIARRAGRATSLPSDLVSDDTALLRELIDDVGRFWISPDFGAWYTSSRTSLRSFLRNAFYRGGTSVDGYAGRRGALGTAVVLVPTAALLALVATLASLPRAPGLVGGAVGSTLLVLTIAIAVTAKRSGMDWGTSTRAGLLAGPFLVGFIPGMWRAWAHRLTRRR